MRHKKLIECSLSHDFFQSGGVFRAEPSLECLRRLKMFSLMFRETEGGFFLLFPCRDYENNIPARAFDREISFDFYIFSSDPSLASYSDLPVYRPGKSAFYFSNLDGAQKSFSAEDNSFEEYASAANQILLRPKRFEPEGETPQCAPADMDLVNEKGESFKERIISRSGKVIVDLENREAGRYTLKLGEQSADYYLENGLSSRTPFGVVSLSVSDQVAASCRIADLSSDGEATGISDPGKRWLIRVKNRETFWRYHVVSKFGGNNLADMKIVNNCGDLDGVEFPYVSDDGREALFASGRAISMRETGYPDISLCRNDGQILVPHLPNARPGLTRPEGDKVYSDIFVYV